MPRKGNIIPKAPLSRLMKEHGAARVSDKGLEKMSNLLFEYASDISKKAIKAATHSGRKTVLDSDIKIANR